MLNLSNRELAEFLAFLGEEEAALERLEGGEVSELQLEERQESVRARDGQFCSLASRGKEQVQFSSYSFFLSDPVIPEVQSMGPGVSK